MKTSLLIALTALLTTANSFSSELMVYKLNEPATMSTITSVVASYREKTEAFPNAQRALVLTGTTTKCSIVEESVEKYGLNLIEVARLIAEDKVDVTCDRDFSRDLSHSAQKVSLTFKIKN